MLHDPKWDNQKAKTDQVKTELSETAKCLLFAAKLLEEKGWCQGLLIAGQRHCVSGAIQAYYPEGIPTSKVWEIHSLALLALTENINDKIATWNDVPERTKEEVIAKLRELSILVR